MSSVARHAKQKEKKRRREKDEGRFGRIFDMKDPVPAEAIPKIMVAGYGTAKQGVA